MRKRLVLGTLTLAAVLAVGNCKDDVGLTSIPPDPERFIAFLNGDNVEVPVATPAQGMALFTVSGSSLIYRVELSNIDNVTIAHIHSGAAGVSGGIIQDLYVAPLPPKGLDFSGTLIEDTVPVVAAVLTQMRGGTAYVNVHTNDGVPPTNTGPGDMAGGEIRGQIFRLP
jgi:CHRD domain-containing protein